MKCEVIAVGTELLLGQIVDTNSSWIGEQLALHGIDTHYQTKVGDNWDRIADAIRLGLDRSDAIIMCGGLGPTQDDITRDVVADVMGVELVLDPAIEAKIREMFASRGREMPENNVRQAMVPVGARTIAQQPGTAPGLACELTIDGNDKVIYLVPGVPYEMKEMVSGTVLPELQDRAGVRAVIESRVLRTWGQSESGLAEMLADRIDELDEVGNPTLAFLASGVEGIKIRITAKAPTSEEIILILDAEETFLRGLLGDIVFGLDEANMEVTVMSQLAARGWTIGVAESVTGGYVAGRLAAVPGASEVLRGSVTAYVPDVKFSVLGVPEGPVVTPEAALAMAHGVRDLLKADVGIASTGVAGPGGEEGVEIGTVHLAIVTPEGERTETVRLPGDRERIRQYSCISLLNMLRLDLDRDLDT
ncbi:MAG: nicotinamide-nucleotide amidase [Candidatus Poriferisodalaceae bacterium]|jgi:nicotinamide-nucleotide amidase